MDKNLMDKKKNTQDATNLERVIEKNQHYLDTVAEELLQACIGARSTKEVPDAVIENVLKVYGSMRARLSEIDVVRALLLRRHKRSVPEIPRRAKLIAELDTQIAELSSRLRKGPPPAAGRTARTAWTRKLVRPVQSGRAAPGAVRGAGGSWGVVVVVIPGIRGPSPHVRTEGGRRRGDAEPARGVPALPRVGDRQAREDREGVGRESRLTGPGVPS